MLNARIHRRHSRRRGASSLLELLLVVATISTLVAIVLPALANARRAGRRVACQSNLRQIGLAWQMYLDENEGRFYQRVNANVLFGGVQGRGSPTFGANPGRPVEKPLNRYLNLPLVAREGADVFRCPADEGGGSVRPSCFRFYGTSYSTNQLLIGQNQLAIDDADPCKAVFEEVNTRMESLSRSQVTVADSKLILAGDMGWLASLSRTDPTRIEWHTQPATHNIAFLDGHVEFVQIRKGMHVTEDYTTIPYADLGRMALETQREGPAS